MITDYPVETQQGHDIDRNIERSFGCKQKHRREDKQQRPVSFNQI